MNRKEVLRSIDKNFPDYGPISNLTRSVTKGESPRFRGSIRLSTGAFWTDEEFRQLKEEVLSTPLK